MKRKEESKMKDRIELGFLVGIFMLSVMALTPSVEAQEIVHKFKEFHIN